jgi:transcriptional regulator NrdR family protein
MLVVKKDGSMEEFDKEKIRRSCLNAGVAPDVAENITNEIANLVYENMTTEEIRVLILSRLRKADPACVQKWMDYEKNK